MEPSSRRAVITGLGVLSPLGLDPAGNWAAYTAGRSGVRPLQGLDASRLPSRIAGEVVGFDPKKYLDQKQRRSLKMMSRTVQLGVCSAQRALEDCGYKPGMVDPMRFGVEYGSGMIATELDDFAVAAKASTNCQPGSVSLPKWGADGLPVINPLWMLKYLPNMPSCHISILHDAQGPNNSITESDAASLLAMGEAYRILGRGWADFFLVGGADSKLNPLSLSRHSLFLPLSKRNEEPEKAMRPFDRHRDGLVMAEGSATFALEDLALAKSRGAKIYAEVVGFASGFDRKQDGTGLARVVRRALEEAGIGPESVDHVNGHGISTAEADVWEAKGLSEVFGPARVPVWAPKSYMGNLGAGGSVVELAGSLLAMRHGQLPVTLNYEAPDPACPVLVHAHEPRPVVKPYVVKVSFTDLGQCAALVVRKWDE